MLPLQNDHFGGSRTVTQIPSTIWSNISPIYLMYVQDFDYYLFKSGFLNFSSLKGCLFRFYIDRNFAWAHARRPDRPIYDPL